MSTKPTGATHEVGLEDLFFSTTDSRGVIEQANKVFVDIARTPREDLIGAPHNVIRHPDMPGGAFRIVWETIGAKEPVCAYVHNLAGDGSAYWAFATITPLANGYLSVRSRPCDTTLQGTVHQLYERVRAEELTNIDKGMTPPKAARLGQTVLLSELKLLGYDSYRDFMLDVLPAEVEARAAMGAKIPARPGATGAPKAMLDAITDVEGRVRRFNMQLRGADQLAGELESNVAKVIEGLAVLEASVSEARAIVNKHEETAPLVASATPAVEVKCADIGQTLKSVQAHVHETHALRKQLRFSTCLAQMQAESVCRFVIAVIDGDEDTETTQHATKSLVAALDAGISQLSRDIATDSEQANRLAEEIKAAESALRVTNMVMKTWRELVVKYGLQDEMTDVLAKLDQALNELPANLAKLHENATEFAESVIVFSISALEDQLAEVLGQSQAMTAWRKAA